MTTFHHHTCTCEKRVLQHLHILDSNACKDLRIVARKASSFVPKRVLIVSKLSRYGFEKLRDPSLNEEQLKLQVESRGADYHAMLQSHQATKLIENDVVNNLKKLSVEYRVVDRSKLDKTNFDWADLILPIGGDGTFLLASNVIFNNQKPILGINSYPGMSEGFLMLQPKYTKNIAEIFEKLRAGHYGIVMRTRIRTTLIGDNIWNGSFHINEKARIAGGDRYYDYHNSEEGTRPKQRRLPWLALNEVYMGESLSARTSTLLIKLDNNEQSYRIRSSGICVCTGTGSTSWVRSMNIVTPQTVREILALANTNKHFSDDEVGHICDTFNQNLQFNPEESKICYSVRDMIVMSVWPSPKGISPRAHCEKITVKSNCYDAGLVLDGGISIPFTYGTTAVLETYPEDALRTITLPD